MSNVTYLFGAGASANALPTYANFGEKFTYFCGFIKWHQNKKDRHTMHTLRLINELITKLDVLNEELKFHSTPDTVAKKYFHTGKTEQLRWLKVLLVLFFSFEQDIRLGHERDFRHDDLYGLEKRPVERPFLDMRYDAFLASLLKPKQGALEFIRGVNILTWNYDLQLELAYSNYTGQHVDQIQGRIQSIPFLNGDAINCKPDCFSVVHLNGIAYSNLWDEEKLKPGSNSNLFDKVIKLYEELSCPRLSKIVGGDHFMTFAWENISSDYKINNNSPMLNQASAVAQKTEILIVCGYSFPIFNRLIDTWLLKQMPLREVLIQDRNGVELKALLSKITDLNRPVTTVTDLGYYNQFHIPDQLLTSYDSISSLLEPEQIA